MRIIIIGAGEVGFHLAQRLSKEKNDVVVIDRDPDKIERMQAMLDVQAELVQALTILKPFQAMLFLDSPRHVLFYHILVAAQEKLADLEVWHQLAIREKPATNTGAQGDGDDGTLDAAACAKAHFSHAGCICVI